MIKVLFVCFGNICRSPMGEFILKDMVKKENLENNFEIASAGTSDEEIGNSVYYLAKKKLNEYGISCKEKVARQLQEKDLFYYDYILAMETSNVKEIERIGKGKKMINVFRLLDFANENKDIEDPWYTRDFEASYKDIKKGCEYFLEYLKGQNFLK